MAKDKKGTVAKVDKFGVWAHKHEGNTSFHWACAGHGDATKALHATAANPEYPDGTTEVMKASYRAALSRKEGFVSYSPSRAYPKGLYVSAKKPVGGSAPRAPKPEPVLAETPEA